MKRSSSSRVLSSLMIFLNLKRTRWHYCPSPFLSLTKKLISPQENGLMNKSWPWKLSKRLSLPMLKTCGLLPILTQGVKTVSFYPSSGRSLRKSRKERKGRLNSVTSTSQLRRTGKLSKTTPRAKSFLKRQKSPSTVIIRRVLTFTHETSRVRKAFTHGFLVTLIISVMATGGLSSIKALM